MINLNESPHIFDRNDIFWIVVTILNISNALDVYLVAYPALAIAFVLLIARALKERPKSLKGPIASVFISGVTHALVGNYISASIFIGLFILSLIIHYRILSDQ